MSVDKEDVISPEEMRKRLYQTFKNRGVLDTLKTQLRNQLIHELKPPPFTGDTFPKAFPADGDSVMISASNSLVADHLLKAGYEYTLSVFYPESGLNKDKVFSTRDFLQLLNISPQSPLYKSLTASVHHGNQKAFLMKLLTELTDLYMHRRSCDADTQTTSTPEYRESLVEKMQMIEDKYAALRQQGNKWQSEESKLTEYRKEVEAQLQAEMELKLNHFKDVELAKIRMEEKEKSRREISELRRDLEKTYEMKSEGLLNRERNAIERLQRQQEVEEKEIYVQRQSLLKEIDAVRNREAELRHRIETFEKTCKLQEEKSRSSEELLRRRELAVKTLEDSYEQKLKTELTRYQLELKEEYLKRTEKVSEDEKKNKAEALRLQKELDSVEAKAEEHRQACASLSRLQMELNAELSRNSLLSQQNTLLQQRLEGVSDYTALKRDKVELEAHVELVTKQLEEQQELNQQLRTETSQPSKEELALRAEMKQLEAARKLMEEEFEAQKQVLLKQLRSEVEHCAQLKAQLAEYQEKAQWMAAHTEEMKLQLRQTQLALENEVLRNPKPSLVDRSVLNLTADKIVPPDVYVDGLIARTLGQRDYEPGLALPRLRGIRSGSPDSDTDLVAGAKARIRELEKEAESLEEAYRSYQQRATRAAVSALHPSMTHSPPPKLRPLHTRPVSQPRVTFAQEGPLPDLFSGFVSAKLLESLDFNGDRTPGDQTPPECSSDQPRRLSSTPLSIAKGQLSRGPVKDTQGSPVTFSGLSSARQLSPIPPGEMFSPGAVTAELSPPGSPPLRSTAREPRSLPKAKQEVSSSESSPHPEKISLEDLTEPLSGPSHIPQLLQDEADHLFNGVLLGQEISGSAAADLLPEQQLAHKSEEAAQRGEDEDVKWELERRAREEQRRQERLEALEREQWELERLEQERLLKEALEQDLEREPGQGLEVCAIQGGAGAPQGGATDVAASDADTTAATDPLQKYMTLVMQGKEAQSEPSPEKDVPDQSAEAVSDDSIVAFTHEEADEDFW